MKNENFFYKRFSVGLTLDATLEGFETFLRKYHRYISNFYFSLPMGDRFHSRVNVKKQLRDPNNVTKFWQMLRMIKSFEIDLELVLNNWDVKDEDVYAAKSLLVAYDIEIDLVGITNDIYSIVRSVFPDQKIVYSFNNRTNTQKEFEQIPHHYDEIVLGRQNIRNTALFDYIHNGLQSKVVLLLNNGCSHHCGGCSTLPNCHSAYYHAKFSHSSEYLYALQSIMPYEIHDGLLDTSCVDYFKINSRNASLQQLSDCMDSYINCVEDEYIDISINNYMLWGRLAWHMEYYDEFSLDKIRKIKSSIYSKQPIEERKSHVNFCLDLRDRYIFDTSNEQYDINAANQVIKQYTKGVPYTLEECVIGVSNCHCLLSTVSHKKTMALISELKTKFNRVYFEFPPMSSDDVIVINEILELIVPQVDCIIVNDWAMAVSIRDNYSIPIAAGESLSFSMIESPANDCMIDNDQNFGKGLIREELLEKINTFGELAFLVCDMLPEGICISKSEKQKLLINLCQRNIALDTCVSMKKALCECDCLQNLDKPCSHTYTPLPWRTHCNSIKEQFTNFERIEKTVLENRATFIINV